MAGMLILVFCSLPAFAARQVLVLNSYHQGYEWTDDVMRGLEVSLHQYDPEVLIHTEYMDMKRDLDPLYLKNLPAFMQLKYAFLRPDIVIATDDSAFVFMLEHGARIFPETPAVFCGVNTTPLPHLPNWMTGVGKFANLSGTLDLMRDLQPRMREIMVISDKTKTGLGIAAELRKIAPADLQLKFLDDLPLSELTQQVRGIGPETGLLFLVYFRDRDGKTYDTTEAISAISQASPVPVFGAWDFLMGHGLFGGFLTNGYEQGRIAGSMAGRIMSGEKPADIPVSFDGGAGLAVDVRQMERFGITPSQFPEEIRFFNANKSANHEILILHSYHTGFKWTDDIQTGIKESLGKTLQNTEVHVEYMDTKRHPEAEYNYLNYILLHEKYRHTKFSVVLTSDDNAFNFARQYRQSIFQGAPIVFCGVNYLQDPASLPPQGITGVLESYDIAGTVQAAARLAPKAKHLFVINDTTPTGVGNHNRFKEVRDLLPKQLRVEMLEDLSMTRLLERLPTLPQDSIILLMSFNRDRDGNTFSYEESCKKIVEASPVPVFSFWDFYLGSGSVGGMVTSGYHQGLAAGKLTNDILHGMNARDLPVISKSPNAFIFDARAMQRFELDRSLLPADATLINDVSDSTRYAHAVRTIAILVLVIAFLLLVFLCVYRWQHCKRRALERTVRIDPLTGACTRGAFDEEMPQKLKLAAEQKERLMLCYVDVNKLKQVNDTYGHLHGDTYLKEVVRILRDSIRATDEIYRIGGDEFVLIFPGCGQNEVQRIWDIVHENIRETNNAGTLPYAMGLTHGCVAFNPDAPQDLPTLLRQADQSMYRRKVSDKS